MGGLTEHALSCGILDSRCIHGCHGDNRVSAPISEILFSDILPLYPFPTQHDELNHIDRPKIERSPPSPPGPRLNLNKHAAQSSIILKHHPKSVNLRPPFASIHAGCTSVSQEQKYIHTSYIHVSHSLLTAKSMYTQARQGITQAHLEVKN